MLVLTEHKHTRLRKRHIGGTVGLYGKIKIKGGNIMENTKTKIINGTKYIIKSFFSDESLSTTVEKIQRIIENKIISEIKTAPLKDEEA